MVRTKSYHAYTNAAHHTTSNTRQIVMLYDGAIRFLQQAKDAMQEGKIEQRYELLVKVSNVLTGLQASLDFDGQREMAGQLYDFYAGLDYRLGQLHQSSDLVDCEAIIEELRGMRAVWDKIDREGANAVAAAAVPKVETPSPA